MQQPEISQTERMMRKQKKVRNHQQERMSANIYRTYSASAGSAGATSVIHHDSISNYTTTNEKKRRTLMNENDDTATATTTTTNQKNKKQKQKNSRIMNNNSMSNTVTQVLAVSSREERIHHPKSGSSSSSNFIGSGSSQPPPSSELQYAIELNVAQERNSSEVFQRFYSNVWKYVRSLPELIHHTPIIIRTMIQSMLSTTTSSSSGNNTIPSTTTAATNSSTTNVVRTVPIKTINYATMDILHLFGVLAREIRHEIHPFLHTLILPTIFHDLLNPSYNTTNNNSNNDNSIIAVGVSTSCSKDVDNVTGRDTTTTNNDDDDMAAADDDDDDDDDDEIDESSTHHQQLPPPILDVATIELIFRTVSYIFKYDQAMILHDHTTSITTTTTSTPTTDSTLTLTPKSIQQQEQLGCCDIMIRNYYSSTICHPNAYIRRLSAETFAPLLRQLHLQQPSLLLQQQKKTNKTNPLVKHIRRTLRALSYNNTSSSSFGKSNNVAQQAAIDGIAYLFFEISRNGTRLHTKCGPLIVTTLLNILMEYSIPSVIVGETTTTTTTTSDQHQKQHSNPQLVVDVIKGTFQLWYHHIQNEEDLIHIITHTIVQTMLHQYIKSDAVVVAVNHTTDTTIATGNESIQYESALIVSLQMLQNYFYNSLLKEQRPQAVQNGITAPQNPFIQRLIRIVQPLWLAVVSSGGASTKHRNNTITTATIMTSSIFRSMNGTCQGSTLDLIYTIFLLLLQHNVHDDPTTVTSRKHNGNNRSTSSQQYFHEIVTQLSPLLTMPMQQVFTSVITPSSVGVSNPSTAPVVVAHHVIQNCLPYMLALSNNNSINNKSSSMVGTMVSSIIRATIQMMRDPTHHQDQNTILTLLHGLVSVRMRNATTTTITCINNIVDNDCNTDFIFLDRAVSCFLPEDLDDDITKLLNQICLVARTTTISFDTPEQDCANIVAACKVSSFLVVLGIDRKVSTNNDHDIDDDMEGDDIEDDGRNVAIIERARNRYQLVSQWHQELIQRIDAIHKAHSKNGMPNEGTTSFHQIDTALSMAIESLSHLSIVIAQQSDKIVTDIKSVLGKVRSTVVRHLLTNPYNLWVLKSTSKFVEGLQTLGMTFDTQGEGEYNEDDIYDALLPCLRSQYHFHRLPALQILSSLPKRQYVVDHADLDLTDDLDEEHDTPTPSVARPTTLTSSYVGLCGPCNIMDLLLSIESMSVSMQTERTMLSNVARIGVLGRTGKLPVVYAEAAVSHMIGLLNIKFSPIWPVAVKSLIDLTLGHEDCVWPALHDQISTFMALYPTAKQPQNNNPSEANDRIPIDPLGLYSICRFWEMSNGAETSLFNYDIHAVMDHGRVSRHHASDASSVVASLWSVVQGAPKLITVHSRTLVPIFLRFIYHQYYAVHINDPDSREIDILATLNEIDDHDDSPSNRYTATEISFNGRQVQQRLLCIVKAFASVKGPQQLFKHKVLLSIFLSFIGSQDNSLSQAALSFVLKYKLPYLVQYNDTLNKFYEKGMLRDAMMQMNSDMESGKINPDHRPGLIPVLCRILFGRLSSRGGGGTKSSKDSPSARRTAVVSFLSSFCHDDNELYPFLYLMMRVYIPTNFTMSPIEMHGKNYQKEVVNAIVNSESYDYGGIPVQVHQGFLNVLESVITQLGRKMIPFVSTFMSITVKLCKTYEVKRKTELRELSSHPDLDNDDGDPTDDEATNSPNDRTGSIRSLCYTRLASIFANFSDAVDFSQYTISLWESLDHSLRLLPVMVLNSDKVPSLLNMLRIMSGEESLISMLKESEQIIPSVLLCLSSSSKNAVIETVLVFIDNLLEVDDGRKHLHQHIELMLDQFVSRMGCAPVAPIQNARFKSKSHTKGQTTWRRELSILCKVSELVDETSCVSMANKSTNVMETMCELLIPYLDLHRGIPDLDKQRILEILKVMIVKISPVAAADHYASLAALLGPFKSKSGIASRDLRKSLATVLGCIANTSYKAAILSTNLLQRLCAVSGKRIDEMDNDLAIPAISELGSTMGELGWLHLCGVDNDRTDPIVLLPIMYACFNFLFDDDGVVSRGSFNALTALVTIASREIAGQTNETWKKFLEGSVLPMIKLGLSSHVEFTRRFYILLLKEVVQQNKDVSSAMLFHDLSCLIRDDEPDLDFFLNITHVQLHRRARALQRLRKVLTIDVDEAVSISFSMQSLSSILLPLATHPIYESKTKLDENFALEGIATVGAISRHLSWSKYNSLLWNHLTQFERHPELEKYLIGLICAIIDGFHFQIESCVENNNYVGLSLLPSTNSIWRALENRIIPKIESMMVKQKTDRKGAMLRPSVLLALHKLIHKLPTPLFQSKLPRLLAVVCNALCNRESDARDIARVSLAKMVVEMDMEYLLDVLRELATSLTEGYKLHVRNATIHTILLELSKVYTPPDATGSAFPTFDKSVPALMDLIQQDIFGEAQERRDAQGNQVRFVKEAGGAKSANSFELIATMILFRPAVMLQTSSVHMLVTPLLERIRTPGVSTTVTRRIKECLARIVSGLLRNPSVQGDSVMQFVYATLDPFVSKHEIELVMELMDDESSSDEDDPVKPIQVSGKRKSREPDSSTVEANGHVVEWRPSILKSVTTTKAARNNKEKHESESFKVQDGASAPKLTGSGRMATANSGEKKFTVNDTATVCAVIFGLQLLSPTLKNFNTEGNNNIDDKQLDRFVPLLTTCVCRCRNTDVVLLALRCLSYLMKTYLPSLARCSKSLAAKTLELITSAGSNQELLQSTFKMLTFLMSFDRKSVKKNNEVGERSGVDILASRTLPLNDEQLQVLISFLRESVVSTDQHNPAIALIKAIMSRNYISVEFYDLMETMLEQSVRSSKPTLRDQSGIVFLHYLINYPLTAEKVEKHLKQIVLNLSYEYAEGRMSAIALALMIIDKLPQPVIDNHCQLFFFPLSLQLVNDDSQDCRALVAKCLGKLVRSVSIEVLQTLFDYMTRWLDGDVSLQRMSLQLLKILVEIRPDYVKRIDTTRTIIQKTNLLMTERASDWEIQYFCLLLVEVMIPNFNHQIIQSDPLWQCIVESMVNDHVWVKLSAVRLISNHVQDVDPTNMSSSQTFLMNDNGSGLLFRMARNLCYQLGVDESQQIDDMTTMAIKVLTWTVQAATAYPSLCNPRDSEELHRTAANVSDDGQDDDSVDDDQQANTSNRRPNPVQWIITRLSNLARLKGTKRRQSIFKCFAAFITLLPSKEATLYPYLEKIVEPLYRVDIETKNDGGDGTNYLMLLSKRSSGGSTISEEGQLAKDVLQLLESHCTASNQTELFFQAYQNVQNRFKVRKERRKAEMNVRVVTNPTFAAQQRVDKQIREKHRRQRRVQERRIDRGAGGTTVRRQRDV